MPEVKIKRVSIYFDQLQAASDKAEQDTATRYNSQTCSLQDVDGNHTCPICYFRQRVKVYLGIYIDDEV